MHKLLDQVKTLADRLAFAFNTPTGIPYNNLHFDTNTSDDKTNGLATIGTLVLEWTHLSDLTGNKTYADLAQRAESYLLHPSLDKVGGPPYPGLLGSNVNISTGEFTDANGGWGGGTDSYYEYLLKMYIYSPSRFPEYLTRWIAAVDGTITHLIAPGTRGFVSEYTAPPAKLHPEEGHLTCFMAGNFILGGDLISRNDIKSAGLWLTQGCHTTYLNSPSGVGPERWSWDRTKVPSEYAAFYAKHGWYPTNNYYQLRPEVVESYYHAYRLTGNPVYREWAWEAFVAIDAMCRTEVGYTGVENIMHKDGGERSDFMESFWFAEVLKYLWLIFSEGVEGGKVGIVKGRGDWVFNTEAHPLRVAAA